MPLSNFENIVEKFIRRHRLIAPGDRVLVGFSGGIDSTVLLYLLNQLRPELDCFIAAAHFNHRLRGEESERDQRFTQEIAEKLKLDYFNRPWTRKPASKSASLQAEARTARFDFFKLIMERENCNKLALGHNSEDQVETVLMALMRGFGISGLKGIQPLSDYIIHPLLQCSRQQIEEYARAENLRWVEDSSNLQNKYLRNKVRNIILPELKDAFPNIENALLRLGDDAAELDKGLEQETEKAWNSKVIMQQNSEVILDIVSFLQYFTVLQKKLLRSIFRIFDPELKPPPGVLEAIIELCESQTGAICGFGGVTALKDRNLLRFRQSTESSVDSGVELGTVYEFEGRYFSMEPFELKEVKYDSNRDVEYIDRDKLSGKLRIRPWCEGDRFRPLGLNGETKVSDYFINNKLSRFDKQRTLILTDDEKIVWICGIRLDERVKINSNTIKVIRLTCRNAD